MLHGSKDKVTTSAVAISTEEVRRSNHIVRSRLARHSFLGSNVIDRFRAVEATQFSLMNGRPSWSRSSVCDQCLPTSRLRSSQCLRAVLLLRTWSNVLRTTFYLLNTKHSYKEFSQASKVTFNPIRRVGSHQYNCFKIGDMRGISEKITYFGYLHIVACLFSGTCGLLKEAVHKTSVPASEMKPTGQRHVGANAKVLKGWIPWINAEKACFTWTKP